MPIMAPVMAPACIFASQQMRLRKREREQMQMAELRRPRSESPLQSEIKNLHEIRTEKQFPRASCALATPLLS